MKPPSSKTTPSAVPRQMQNEPRFALRASLRLRPLLLLAGAVVIALSCGNPVPLQERHCPCAADQGYVCCALFVRFMWL